MNARFYVVGNGRFASADTIVPNSTNPQSFNRYSYAMNSSLNFQDPVCNRDSSICSDSKFGDEPPIILIGINYHVRNPAVVFGGAIMVIVVHLALAGGVAHIVSALKKRFHGEPDEVV